MEKASGVLIFLEMQKENKKKVRLHRNEKIDQGETGGS